MTTVSTPRKIATTATANATLGKGSLTPVDATAAARTMTLPTDAVAGVEITVEKVDASTNAVTISGTFRGTAGTITLTSQYEARTFLSEGAGSWRPISDHRTAASLAATPGADLQAPGVADAMRPWFAALSNRDYAKASAVFVGTSMTEGGYVTTGRERRWLDRLAVGLRSRFPLASPVTGSTGYIPAFYQSFIAGGTSQFARITPTGVTYSGSLNPATGGLGNRTLELAASGDFIQFTFTGTGADLLHETRNVASSAATVSIDGAAGTALNVPAATATAAVLQIRGLTAGSHTVRVTWGSGQVDVDGLYPYNGDEAKGIHIFDAGKGSSQSSAHVPSNNYRQFATIQPALVAYELIYNDFFNDIPVATYKSNLTSVVANSRALVTIPPTSLFLILPEPVDSTPGAIPYADYVTATKEVAATTTNAVVLDFSTRMPKAVTNTLGWFYTDFVHFSDKGAAYVADVLTKALSPS